MGFTEKSCVSLVYIFEFNYLLEFCQLNLSVSYDKACNTVEKQQSVFQKKIILGCRCGPLWCESCTPTADLERQIQAFENKCYRRIKFDDVIEFAARNAHKVSRKYVVSATCMY